MVIYKELRIFGFAVHHLVNITACMYSVVCLIFISHFHYNVWLILLFFLIHKDNWVLQFDSNCTYSIRNVDAISEQSFFFANLWYEKHKALFLQWPTFFDFLFSLSYIHNNSNLVAYLPSRNCIKFVKQAKYYSCYSLKHIC